MMDYVIVTSRMTIIGLFKFNIRVEIITGTQACKPVYISRIIWDTGEFFTLPFILYKRQLLIDEKSNCNCIETLEEFQNATNPKRHPPKRQLPKRHLLKMSGRRDTFFII